MKMVQLGRTGPRISARPWRDGHDAGHVRHRRPHRKRRHPPRDRLAKALGALEVTLDDKDLAAIEQAVPKGAAAGDRYPTPMMAHLDSEQH